MGEKGSEGHTARIGMNFAAELELIKNGRLEKGMDKKRRSTRKLTELMIRHNSWDDIKSDMIELNLEGSKNG